MSIINEQNILGNPELADAFRPGSDVTIADYSFGTLSNVYEKILHEAMGLARGGDWTKPIPYSGEVDQAEVEGESSSEQTGVAGVPLLASPTRYGGPGVAPLSENATMQTKNTQAARVIAGEALADSFVNPTSSAVRSGTITEDSAQGPVASGGQYNGYEYDRPYEGYSNANDGRGSTTEPAPIEDTGIIPYINLEALRAFKGEPSDDEPKRKKGKKKRTNKLSKRSSGQRFTGPPRFRVHRRMGYTGQQSLKNPMTQKSTATAGEDYLQDMLG